MAIPTSHPPAPTGARRKGFGEMAHPPLIAGPGGPGPLGALCAAPAAARRGRRRRAGRPQSTAHRAAGCRGRWHDPPGLALGRRRRRFGRLALPDVRVRFGAAVVGERRISETGTPRVVSETFTAT